MVLDYTNVIFVGASGRLPRSLSLSRSRTIEPIPLLSHRQGGGDVSQLPQPDGEGEAAVKDFHEFLTNNNMR